MRGRPIRRWGAAAVATVLLAACAGTAAAPPRSSSVRLHGTLLGSGRTFGLGLVAYTIPTLKVQGPLQPPDPPPGAEGGGVDYYQAVPYYGAYWTDQRHTAIGFVGQGGPRAGLYRLSVGGEAVALGTSLSFVSAFDVRGNTALAATCRVPPGRVQVIGVDGRGEWREVARSCQASLSPDGSRIAYVQKRTEVWEQSVEGGSPTKLFDVADVADVRRAHIGHMVITQMAWGRGGLALAVGNEDSLQGGFGGGTGRMALVVRDNQGTVRMAPVQPQELSLPIRPWQPTGDLLAFICRPTSGGAVMRLFDPTTGKVRVVAADEQFFGDAVWSPDGNVLVANTSNNAIVFFDLQGRWIERVGGGGIAVLDWTP